LHHEGNNKNIYSFFDDREVRALWDAQKFQKWWFSVLDIMRTYDQDDYAKTEITGST